MLTVHYTTDTDKKLIFIRFDSQGIGKVDTVLPNFDSILLQQVTHMVQNSVQDIAPDIRYLLEQKRDELEEEKTKPMEKLASTQEDKVLESSKSVVEVSPGTYGDRSN